MISVVGLNLVAFTVSTFLAHLGSLNYTYLALHYLAWLTLTPCGIQLVFFMPSATFRHVYIVHLLGPKPLSCALARIKLQLAARNLLFNANSARCSCNCWPFDCHNMHSAALPTPARGNKQLVDLYYKIIFTPSSKHKKKKNKKLVEEALRVPCEK